LDKWHSTMFNMHSRKAIAFVKEFFNLHPVPSAKHSGLHLQPKITLLPATKSTFSGAWRRFYSRKKASGVNLVPKVRNGTSSATLTELSTFCDFSEVRFGFGTFSAPARSRSALDNRPKLEEGRFHSLLWTQGIITRLI